MLLCSHYHNIQTLPWSMTLTCDRIMTTDDWHHILEIILLWLQFYNIYLYDQSQKQKMSQWHHKWHWKEKKWTCLLPFPLQIKENSNDQSNDDKHRQWCKDGSKQHWCRQFRLHCWEHCIKCTLKSTVRQIVYQPSVSINTYSHSLDWWHTRVLKEWNDLWQYEFGSHFTCYC